MRLQLKMLCVALVCLTTFAAASAQDAQKGKKKSEPGANAQVFQLPKEVELTAEQQAKLDEIKKEWAPKVGELQKKMDEILSSEQRKARQEAQAKAREDKVTGKERTQRLMQALNLTAEQQEQWDKAQKELNDTTAKIREKIAEFLTDEQKSKVPNLVPKKKKNA